MNNATLQSTPLYVLFFTFLFLSTSLAGDAFSQSPWKQFRGENRDGRVVTNPGHITWAEPEVLWSKEIGAGFSEVAVVDNRIYLMMAEMQDTITGWETLLCMDADSGEVLWSTRVDEVYIDEDEWGNGPRATPTVDDERIYVFSGSGKLAAIDRADGQLLWEVDFVESYGSTIPRWGYAASPLLTKDKILIEVGGTDNHGFAAFRKTTGELLWHKEQVVAAYNSAISAEIDGQQQFIFVSGSKLYAYDEEGASLWTFTMPLRSPMALPVFIAPNRIFVSAANDAGSFVIQVNENQAEEVMRSNRMRNDWSSSTYKDGYFYGFNVATLLSMDAETGERKWLRRGFGKGSLIMVDDRLFILSDMGHLTVAEATPEEYREIATLDVLEGRSWTAPSYYNGRLFVRNHTHMASVRIMMTEENLQE